MDTLVLPKPAYNILSRLTGEIRPDVALSGALKDLVRLRLEAAQGVIAGYEKKYGMPFSDFHAVWQSGSISNPHTYQVEEDFWTWEAAESDLKALQELAESIVI